MYFKKAHNLLYLLLIIPTILVAQASVAATERAALGINIASGRYQERPVEGVAIVGVTPGGSRPET